jgi:hypothetical protein
VQFLEQFLLLSMLYFQEHPVEQSEEHEDEHVDDHPEVRV